MKEVVIAGYLRTAQTRSRPNDPARDWFCKMRSDELLGKLLPEAIKKTGIDPKEIDDFIVGCATGVSEQFTFGGRFPLFLANLPETIPAKFVDQQCGSAMAGIHIGFMEIAMDFADIVMVGGMEHMTRVPMGGPLIDRGAIVPNMGLFMDPSYQHWDMMTSMNMGLTAEKLFAQCDFTKEDMDKWGVRSHQLAAKAQAEGFFADEILPIDAEQADGSVMTVDTGPGCPGGDDPGRSFPIEAGIQKRRRDNGRYFFAAECCGYVHDSHVKRDRKKERYQATGNHPFHRFCRCGSHHHGGWPGARFQKGTGKSRLESFGYRFLGDQRGLLHRGLELHQGSWVSILTRSMSWAVVPPSVIHWEQPVCV